MNLALNDDNEVKIAEQGGIKAVIEALLAHKGSAEVQEAGCCALWNLACNDDNEVKIAEQGGIKAVIEALLAHKGSAEVQEAGCGALCNLAANSKNAYAMNCLGCKDVIIAGMSMPNVTPTTKEEGYELLNRLHGTHSSGRACVVS